MVNCHFGQWFVNNHLLSFDYYGILLAAGEHVIGYVRLEVRVH